MSYVSQIVKGIVAIPLAIIVGVVFCVVVICVLPFACFMEDEWIWEQLM